jgi:type VI protein secretion system component VasK
MFSGLHKRLLFLAIYLIAVACAFWFSLEALALLGLPWSLIAVFFGWLIIHAGSGDAFDWALLLSTFPNIVLIFRSILLWHARVSAEVEYVEKHKQHDQNNHCLRKTHLNDLPQSCDAVS